MVKTLKLKNKMNREQLGHQKLLHWGVFVVLLAAIVFLQLSAISDRSFWEDEAFTAGLISNDPELIIQRLGNDVHPPLYWLLVSSWSKVFGDREWGLKSFSLLCLIFVFVLVYWLAKRLFDDRVALLSAGLFALSPLALTYGHNARYYSLSALFGLLIVIAAQAYFQTNKWFYLGIYVFSSVALLYTLYLGAALLLAVNLWWLWQWISQERILARFLKWSGAQLIIIVLYLPWIATLLSTIERKVPAQAASTNWVREFAVRVGYLGYSFAVGEFYSPLNLLAWLGLGIVVVMLIAAFKQRVQNLWFLLVLLVVSLIPSIISNIIAVYPLSVWQSLPNRTFFLYPFFVILLAYGINQLKGKWLWVVMAVLLVVYAGGIYNYFTNQQVIKPFLTVPWREIFTDIYAQAVDDAVVVCTNDDTACFYYQSRFGFDRFSPQNWEQLPDPKPDDVWWIQSNRGEFIGRSDANDQVFQTIQEQYQLSEVFNYVPQDPGIARLKARFLGTADYKYRVVVYHFVLP